MKIAFVSCTKLKADHACKASEMYDVSTLFKKAVKYIEQQGYDHWFVLSAKYGLLQKEDIIEPYDLTLNNMKVIERKKWTNQVIKQLESINLDIQQADFYTGSKYREYLIPALEQKGVFCTVPLQGRGIGQQLNYYTLNTK